MESAAHVLCIVMTHLECQIRTCSFGPVEEAVRISSARIEKTEDIGNICMRLPNVILANVIHVHDFNLIVFQSAAREATICDFSTLCKSQPPLRPSRIDHAGVSFSPIHTQPIWLDLDQFTSGGVLKQVTHWWNICAKEDLNRRCDGSRYQIRGFVRSQYPWLTVFYAQSLRCKLGRELT